MMFTSLRTIARCLQGQKSLALNTIKKSTVKSFSVTKPIYDDRQNPVLMSTTDAANKPSSSSSSASEPFVAPAVPLMDEPMGESTIIDINIDEMMYEDKEFYNNFASLKEETNVYSPVDGAPVAPVDVDPWAEEEVALDGTTEADKVEKQRAEFIYPPIPKDREGVYEFKGIKIELPKTMMRDSTYRYRLTPEERAMLPDDTRIIVFDAPEMKSESDAKTETESVEKNMKEELKIVE